MIIENKYEIRQTVYLKTDKEQEPRIVSGIRICPDTLIYILSFGTNTSEHYDFEISAEKDLINAI